jgi:Putative DNA-binding domain
MVDLNEADLLARMKNFEDHFVERKVVSDAKDWRKTAVAFANSAPIGIPAVLYIGVKDSGEIETPQKNLDEAQKKFNTQMQKVYPRIPYVPKIISEHGLQALAVIIPGSELRPHFAGPSYVRRGSQSDPASEEQFAELIAQRNSKATLILQWKRKSITASTRTADSEIPWPINTVLLDCNQFYATFQKYLHEPPISLPLSRIEINFDNLRNRLQLEISDLNRDAWNVGLEKHVHQIVGSEMTHQGQLLLNYLLRVGKSEALRQFLPEIPIDVQHKQMDIAAKNQIVLREQERGGIGITYYVLNAEFARALKKVLPRILGQ